MLKKLLLLLLIGFAFTELNAQNIVNNLTDCTNAGSTLVIEEFADDSRNIDGKISYARLTAITPFGVSQSATNGSNANSGIRWSTANNVWEFYAGASNGLGGTVILNNTSTSLLPPANNWTYITGCGSIASLILIGDGPVLPVTREEFSNIKIYPNPSTGFINISNLKETSRVRISNIAGQIVKDVMVGVNDNRIDIQDLAQGFYFVELEGKKTIKLIKR